ncbi:MAG: hypothetical protein AAF204_00630 [Pseudomonadota bacterium]
MRWLAAFASLLLLSSCTGPAYSNYQHYLDKKGLGAQSPESFKHCYGFGCKNTADVELTQKDWKDIKRVFRKSKNPESERAAIKKAIAMFETKVGDITGTHVDEWGTFRKTGHYQLDCVDESLNTTIYLDVLQQRGLLKHHTLETPTSRVPIIHAGRWPHQTAVISENETGEFFAVDSWFHDNGNPPEIVPLTQWKQGWKPEAPDDTL